MHGESPIVSMEMKKSFSLVKIVGEIEGGIVDGREGNVYGCEDKRRRRRRLLLLLLLWFFIILVILVILVFLFIYI